MKELCFFGSLMKCNVNIVLLCFLKLLIMLELPCAVTRTSYQHGA